MCFDSFWHVYNWLRDAVDSEFLFQSSVGVFDEANTQATQQSEDFNIDQLPLSHLRPCEFGKDGIPAEQSIGEHLSYLIPFLSNLSSLPCQWILMVPGSVRKNQVWCPIICSCTCLMFYLEDDLVVDFTDDEGDEIF